MSRGFAEPVTDAQSVFRAVLESLSRPGVCVPYLANHDAPAPLMPTTAAIALCLLDHATPTWLDGRLNTVETRDFLRFHCAVPLVAESSEAQFVFVGEPCTMPPLTAFMQGSEYRPDHTATVVLQLPSVTEGEPCEMTGPGIEHRVTLRAAGLPQDFWRQWSENHDRFPWGIDVILADAQHFVGLPRTVRRS